MLNKNDYFKTFGNNTQLMIKESLDQLKKNFCKL